MNLWNLKIQKIYIYKLVLKINKFFLDDEGGMMLQVSPKVIYKMIYSYNKIKNDLINKPENLADLDYTLTINIDDV